MITLTTQSFTRSISERIMAFVLNTISLLSILFFLFLLAACESKNNLGTDPDFKPIEINQTRANLIINLEWSLYDDSSSNIYVACGSMLYNMPRVDAMINGQPLTLNSTSQTHVMGGIHYYNGTFFDSCHYSFSINATTTSATLYPPGPNNSLFIDDKSIVFDTLSILQPGNHILKWNRIALATSYVIKMTSRINNNYAGNDSLAYTQDTVLAFFANTSKPNMELVLFSQYKDSIFSSDTIRPDIKIEVQRNYKPAKLLIIQ